jgi:hypothetical protein
VFTCGGTLPIGVDLKWNISAPGKVGVSGNKGTEKVDPKLNVRGVLGKVGVGSVLADGGVSRKTATFEAGESACPWACSFTVVDIASGLVLLDHHMFCPHPAFLNWQVSQRYPNVLPGHHALHSHQFPGCPWQVSPPRR